MDKVQHFEIPYDNKERAEKFYKECFNWRFDTVPDMEYTMAFTCDVDDKMMCKETNVINGGFFKRNDKASRNPVIVITVDNLDASLEKIKAQGGEIFMPKTQVGNFGLYAQVKDPEGNVIGVWESLRKEF